MVKKLQIENATLRRNLKHSKTSMKNTKEEKDSEKTAEKQRISLHARKFCVMNEIFVPEAAFLTPNPDFDPLDQARYTSEDFMRKGVIAELFEEVPENLHEKMEFTGAFRDTVSYSHLLISLPFIDDCPKSVHCIT